MAHPDDGDLLLALARAVHAHADADGKKEIAELVARRGIDLEAKPAPEPKADHQTPAKADPKGSFPPPDYEPDPTDQLEVRPKTDVKGKPGAHGKT